MKKSLEKQLNGLNIAIVAHIFATGPALDLEKYLQQKVVSLLFIGHPFSYRKEVSSFYHLYRNGKLLSDKKAPALRLPGILMYFKDAFLTFFWILNSKRKIDLYIGSDGFVAYLGLLLKKIGRVEDVVLYTIDFMPKRFSNPLLNWLYHFFDEQCLKNSKAIWNLSDKMAQGREEYMNKTRGEFVPQFTVPLGIWDKRIPKLPFEKKIRYGLAFMGHLLKKQGLDIVLDAMPGILKKLPKTKLLIIGTGEYESILRNKVKKLKIEKHVSFTGFIEKHEDVENALAENMVALAPYKPDPDSFTYFADPGKIKNYLSAGLPVILTDVPPIAREIEKQRCALISEYKVDSFKNAVIKLLSSPTLLKEYSNNAIKYAKNFDWENIFPKALERTLN